MKVRFKKRKRLLVLLLGFNPYSFYLLLGQEDIMASELLLVNKLILEQLDRLHLGLDP